jgi:hypothetical protein
MLEFVNSRTGSSVEYRPALQTVIIIFIGFISLMAAVVIIYVKHRAFWTHWVVWFFGVLLIYTICISGLVYVIVDDMPFVGLDRETGKPIFFTDDVTMGI